MNSNKIQKFTDLNVWKESHKLVIMVYNITRSFPKSETFGLMSQMQRSAVSITSNIAEGSGRQGMKEKIQFYYLSQGSLTELKNQILVSCDIGYLNKVDFSKLDEQSDIAHRLLQGLITKSKSFLILKS